MGQDEQDEAGRTWSEFERVLVRLLDALTDLPFFAKQIDPPTDSIFQNTKEHCLMGIRGTVRRATDGWFVHTNVSFVLDPLNAYEDNTRAEYMYLVS